MKFFAVASYPESLLKFRGDLLTQLRRVGFDVHAGAPGLSLASEINRELKLLNFTTHDLTMSRTSVNPIGDVKSFFSLIILLLKIKPNYILSYTIKPVIYASLAAAIMQVPHRFALITGLGYAFTGEGESNSLLQSIVKRLYAVALNRCEKVFFQNPDDEKLFRQLGILGPSVPSVVLNGSGVDIASYKVQPQPKVGITFLLIARLLNSKGIREYAEAARMVRRSYPEAKFVLVGWIDDNPDSLCQSEIDYWNESGLIDFKGKLVDVRPAIAEANVYVLPSYREGTPRTVLEAMAMGRPIITTDAPGCRETVIDGDNGFLVPVKDVQALSNAMEKFILQPGLADQMGRRSRAIAEEKYDVHKVNAVMLREMGIPPLEADTESAKT